MTKNSPLRDKVFHFSIVLILIISAIIAIIPLISVIAVSFSSRESVEMNIVNLLPVGFTFDSWKFILTYKELWISLGITVFSTVVGTFTALLVNALMAYPLSKKEFRPSRYLMIFVIITMVFKAPTVPYFLAVRNMGLYNNLLVLILPHILSAYNLSIMRSFFIQFPEEVEEAARIDGCGHFRLLFSIVLPSSAAVLATLGLFYGVTIWNQFQHPIMFIQDIKLFPLQLKIRQLVNQGSEFQQVVSAIKMNYNERTLRSATVIFAILPIIAIYPLIQKHFAKGAMLGSVKG